MTVTTDGRLGWGAHDGTLAAYVDPADVGDVEWFGMRAVRVAVIRAAETGRLATVSGVWGVGKTFAVARACEHYVAHHDGDAQVTYLRGAAFGRDRRIYSGILEGLGGVPVPGAWSTIRLRDEIARHLVERTGIIVIDEAQRLTRAAQEAVQEVTDLGGVGRGVVLVGDEQLPRKLIGELARRRPHDAEVRMSRIDDTSAGELLGALHPVIGATDPDVIRALNRRAGGLLSRWAEFVGNVVALDLDVSDGISAEHIDVLTGRA